MHEWLDDVLQVAGELIVANGFAVVAESVVEEGLSEEVSKDTSDSSEGRCLAQRGLVLLLFETRPLEQSLLRLKFAGEPTVSKAGCQVSAEAHSIVGVIRTCVRKQHPKGDASLLGDKLAIWLKHLYIAELGA